MENVESNFVKLYFENPQLALKWLESEHISGNIKATTYLGKIYTDCVFVKPDFKKAVELLNIAYEKGSTDALRELATLHFMGKYFDEDENVAYDMYSKVLSLNPSDGSAKCQIGRMYGFGWGFDKDVDKGILILKEAWNIGNAHAATEIGVLYEHHKERNIENINEAIKWYQRGANYNDAKGCYNLGLLYYNGDYGLPKSNKVAHDLLINGRLYSDALAFLISTKGCTLSSEDEYKGLLNEAFKRAEFGDLDIQSELGYIYAKGTYIEQDIEKSIYWYERAIGGGHAFSAYRMGTNYCYGFDNYPIDKIKAVHYLNISSEWNNVSAMKCLADLYDDDDYYEISYEEKKKKAMYWYGKAALSGDEWSALTCGRRYENGYSPCAVDENKAIQYYRIAADGGLEDSYLPLAKLYLFSEENKNFELSNRYIILAGKKDFITDYERGQMEYCIGVIYRDGCGIPQDLEEAYKHFNIGSQKGNGDATNALQHLKKGLFGWKLI